MTRKTFSLGQFLDRGRIYATVISKTTSSKNRPALLAQSTRRQQHWYKLVADEIGLI